MPKSDFLVEFSVDFLDFNIVTRGYVKRPTVFGASFAG